MTQAVDRIRTFKELRKGALMSQEQCADALGVSPTTVSMIEAGRRRVKKELYKKIVALFEEEVLIEHKSEKNRYIKHTKEATEEAEKVLMTVSEKKFLRTCWNMREALKSERMIIRDLVDATYEFMDGCEAITYLYKWSKMGFYHYSTGGVVDQGFFVWDKLPPKYRRLVNR